MNIQPEIKRRIIMDFAGDEKNTGCTEAQIGIISYQIEQVEEHLQKHRKDQVAKRALSILVSRRRKLLKYLARKNPKKYEELIKLLGLRKA